MSVILLLIAIPLILIALILFLSHKSTNTKGGHTVSKGRSGISEVRHRFSFTSLCVFAAIAAICAFPFRNDIKRLFALKNDANTGLAQGIITYKNTAGSKLRTNYYGYEFILDERKIHGKFNTNMTFSFTESYEKGEPIDILYNKRINYYYPKDALKGEIVYYINWIMFVSFILWNLIMGFLWSYKQLPHFDKM